MPPPPKYTAAERTAFLAVAHDLQRAGVTKRKIAENLGVNVASLSGWLREETLNRLLPPKPLLMPRNRSNRHS